LANQDDQASRVLLAQTYERSGRSQMALATYREALSRSPQNVEIISRTAEMLWNAREYEELRGILNRVSKEGLSNPALQRLQFQSLIRRNELANATGVLQDYLSTDPNNVSLSLTLALLKIAQDELEGAREILGELRAKEPNSVPTMIAQIQLHIRENSPEDVLKLCNEIITGNSGAAWTYVIRAKACAALGRLEEATEDYATAVSVDPNAVSTWIARSDFYRATGRSNEAIADIEQALALDPENVDIQRLAVRLFLASGKRDKAVQARVVIDRALKNDPDNGTLKLLRAETLLAEKTAPAIESATRILKKLTEEQPELVGAWSLLGRALLNQKLYEDAIALATQGLVHNEKNRSLLMLKAEAEAGKSPFLAIATLNELREPDPNDVTVAMRLADAYLASGQGGKAVSLLTEVLAGCDESSRRLCSTGLAVALYKSDNKAEARSRFDSLLEADPNDSDVILALAQLLSDDKLWDQVENIGTDWYLKHPRDIGTTLAIARLLASNDDDVARKASEKMLKMVLKEHPEDPDIVANLALLMQVRDRNDEAAQFYRRWLEIQPENVDAMNNLAWIICEHQGKHAEALALAEKGLELAPNHIDLIDTRGVAYYRMGKFDKAIQDLSKCVEFYPGQSPAKAVSHFHLGRACAKNKETEKAIDNLKKARRMNDSVGGGLSPDNLAEIDNLLQELQKEGG